MMPRRALVGLAAVVSVAAALFVIGPGAGASLQTTSTQSRSGQLAADSVLMEFVADPGIANRLTVGVEDDGSLTIRDQGGLDAPQGGAGCHPQGPNQVICEPGHVGVIHGTLADGADKLTAASDVPVPFGLFFRGGNRPLGGGSGNDRLLGGRAGDILFGEGGADTVLGAGGADELWGNRGRDVVEGGAGSDVLDGGLGRDTLRGGPGPDDIFGGRRDVVDGGPGFDLCFGGRDGVRRNCEL